MTKLLIDTNIVLDLLARREPFYTSAARLFSLADTHKVMLAVSSLSFATSFYILSKSHPADGVRDILRKLKTLITIYSLNDKIIELALNDKTFADFEDGLQYYTSLENKQDIIITRNQKDFKKSKIPVMNAHEYLIASKGLL